MIPKQAQQQIPGGTKPGVLLSFKNYSMADWQTYGSLETLNWCPNGTVAERKIKYEWVLQTAWTKRKLTGSKWRLNHLANANIVKIRVFRRLENGNQHSRVQNRQESKCGVSGIKNRKLSLKMKPQTSSDTKPDCIQVTNDCPVHNFLRLPIIPQRIPGDT